MTHGKAMGHGVRIALVEHDDQIVGLNYWHPTPADPDVECVGFIFFAVPGADAVANPGTPRWQVESWGPLTISPSLLCRSCGHHGFIRDGRWVPA